MNEDSGQRRQSKRIGQAIVNLIIAVLVVAAINYLYQSNQTYIDKPENTSDNNKVDSSLKPSPVEKNEETSATDSDIRGRRIADRLENECDYWGIDKYNPDGTITISKSVYTNRGGEKVMLIPRVSWNELSSAEKIDLTSYVSENRGITSIIVGEIIPSEKFNRNTITVDETVWP
jgi:hypothetical protein